MIVFFGGGSSTAEFSENHGLRLFRALGSSPSSTASPFFASPVAVGFIVSLCVFFFFVFGGDGFVQGYGCVDPVVGLGFALMPESSRTRAHIKWLLPESSGTRAQPS